MDILEYIHSRDYVHGDIKASNLRLGLGKKQQLYLLNYGLAIKFTNAAGEHLNMVQTIKRLIMEPLNTRLGKG
jgi:serine/threonine protein kinase